eukprot:5297693-Amphidinium_carterae.1
MVHDMLQVLLFGTTTSTLFADMKGFVGPRLMPHPAKSRIQGSFAFFLLTLTIKLELPVGRGSEAAFQA